ncbi:MAG: hypothetical protein QGF09_04725 [Rhodospirillales bacterium]|jgi:hypothetical protein|nr:hypothetical protein [Rhodospirillales bacterium]
MTRRKRPTRIAIHLNGEAPRIGTGRRLVQVLTRGHKWVTVRYWPGGPRGHTVNQKILLRDFDRMVVHA